MKWVFDWHGQDSRATGPLDVGCTVTQTYGAGGGNAPIVIHEVICRGSDNTNAETSKNMATTLKACNVPIIAYKDECLCLAGNFCDRKTSQNGSGMRTGASFTLNTVDRHVVAYDTSCMTQGVAQEQRCYRTDAVAPTLQSRECGGGQGRSFVQLANEKQHPSYIVRRLMPIECGRLQGFPDGWADIDNLPPDMEPETAAFWRKVYETDCAIKGKRPQKNILEKPDKLAEWHNRLHTDSNEYKMWGNGMALPNALFFVQRAVARVVADEGKSAANVKLGSMFDGSGTMPLCAAMCGAQPVWASEVEPYPIAVTKTHLPGMKHLGSVTDIDGGKIDPVDIITFGSPCQDLSVAGKRAGLDGNRSGLFREAIRIILEMLDATDRKYPRFVIWENVPGALSSNEGKDFEVVLNELRKLTGADEPIRKHGKWGGCAGYGAVAYRLVNAQYWGVPQRRRRIYACADTGGKSADQVLFERKGDGWHFKPCIPAGKAVAGIAGDGYCWHERMARGKPEGGNDTAYTLKIRSGCEGGGKGALVQTDISATLATHNDQTVFAPL